MSDVPEEPDFETAALIEKLGPAPERDARAAANGRAKFMAEARSYMASATARREQPPTKWTGFFMGLETPLTYALVVVLVGVVGISMLMVLGPVIGNTFTTINKSLTGVGGPYGSQPGPRYAPTRAPQPATPASGGTTRPQGGTFRNQMVVKNGEIRLLVKDTDRALDGVTQVVTDTRGYVISSRVWYQQDYYGANHKYATVTIGVPVDQFENALRRLRRLAIRVLDENASGDDVTGQYVDLQSQVTNLEATRDRIKSFLDQAKTVDEALRINQQLAEIEAQIETLKGQMNYLSNRSAFSTITVNLEPELPPIKATPGLTPTPTPIAALGPWDPGRTTRQATNMLISVYRLIVDFFIWIFVVVVPILGPPALLIWLAGWLIRRRNRGAAEPGEPLTHA